MNTRHFLSIWIILVPALIHGQAGWTYVQAMPEMAVRFTDVAAFEGGYLVTMLMSEPAVLPPVHGYVLQLDVDGNHVATSEVGPPSASVWLPLILRDPDSLRFHVIGRSAIDSALNFFHQPVLAGPLPGSITSYPMLDELSSAALDNATLMDDGDMVFAGYGRPVHEPSLSKRMMVYRLDNSGALLTAHLYNALVLIAARDVHDIGGDTALVAARGATIGEPGPSTYYKFVGGEMLLEQTFPGDLLADGDCQTEPDDVIVDAITVVHADTDELVISGRAGLTGTGLLAAVQRVTRNGDPLGCFVPSSGYDHDHPPLLEGAVRTDDGAIYMAVMANFTPFIYAPTEPNEVHVHKLDGALNLVCSHVVDGFADGHYYLLNRIKATSDGGYLLVGTRKNMNDPDAIFEGWIRKFSADDCFTSIQEHGAISTALVFPNPGDMTCNILLNGPMRTGAVVHLHDGRGRMLRSAQLNNNTVQLDVRDLAAGLYLYRITGADGDLLASGKWLKE